jgi:low affinity Fe/Cu permease
MTLFIQRAERRDTPALHAKLDELLRASGKARDELTEIDQEESEEIEEQRRDARG